MYENPKQYFGRIVSLIVLSIFFMMSVIAFTVSDTPARYVGLILIIINLLLFLYMLVYGIISLYKNIQTDTTSNDRTMHVVNLVLALLGTGLFSVVYIWIITSFLFT